MYRVFVQVYTYTTPVNQVEVQKDLSKPYFALTTIPLSKRVPPIFTDDNLLEGIKYGLTIGHFVTIEEVEYNG